MKILFIDFYFFPQVTFFSLVSIDNVMVDLEGLIDECKRRLSANVCFRRSIDKKNPEVQALPINLLGQLLVMNGIFCDESTGFASEKLTVKDMLTCGAMTHHARKSKGGIFDLENRIAREVDRLAVNKHTLFTANGGRPTVECLSEIHDFDDMIDKTTKMVLSIETDCLEVCHRRIVCVSQALSIVVNGIIMKLNLVAEGHISQKLAEAWESTGILIVFEGLLSVTGKERTMLDDSFSAIGVTINSSSISFNRFLIGFNIKTYRNPSRF